MIEHDTSGIIIEEAITVHKTIGPGLLESADVHCLAFRLAERGVSIKREVGVPVVFEQVKLECGYRADMVVGGKVVVEVKSIDAIADIHVAQTLTYLRFLNLRLGILLNFNSVLMKNGIRRVVNNL